MFYSQFILAKKGPLGTIWIAAHLERKLRKNQVADTDIGESVDSILSPDVPIALRLSSHLLVGVVRIYSRKVNYLFHDCSEALLKIKQAFRSTAVDLPPEESTAPYHSITLPETFDLDDFELPDSALLSGNFVDHHVSTREQITLQDTVDATGYSTSQFGLDERFGDGDASQIRLDLDEDMLLDKVSAADHISNLPGSGDADGKIPGQPETPFPDMDIDGCQNDYDEEHNAETAKDISERFADDLGRPVLQNVQNLREENPSDDYNVQIPCLHKEVSHGDHVRSPHTVPDDVTVTQMLPDSQFVQNLREENPSDDYNVQIPCLHKEVSHGDHVRSPHAVPDDVTVTQMLPDSTENAQAPSTPGLMQEAIPANVQENPALSPSGKASPSNDTEVIVVNSAQCSHVEPDSHIPNENDISNAICKMPSLSSILEQPEIVTPATQPLVLSLTTSDISNPPCGDSTGAADSCQDNATLTSIFVSSLRPCNTKMNQGDITFLQVDTNDLLPNESDVADGKEQLHAGGSSAELQDVHWKSGRVHTPEETDLNKDVSPPSQIPKDARLEVNYLASSEYPEPERMLFATGGNTDVANDLGQCTIDFGQCTTIEKGVTESDVNVDKVKGTPGRKRRLTESTPVMLNGDSPKLSRPSLLGRNTDDIPDDDDVLASILVGRSSGLKMKPTPIPSVMPPSKRTRLSGRSGVPKRKVLMDDTMVLHADAIRQQLINTEDIRRTRRKAPCTNSEIWMIQKCSLEEEMFIEPLLTGVTVELVVLHSQAYVPNEIPVSNCPDVEVPNVKNSGSSEFIEETRVNDATIVADKCDDEMQEFTDILCSAQTMPAPLERDADDQRESLWDACLPEVSSGNHQGQDILTEPDKVINIEAQEPLVSVPYSEGISHISADATTAIMSIDKQDGPGEMNSGLPLREDHQSLLASSQFCKEFVEINAKVEVSRDDMLIYTGEGSTAGDTSLNYPKEADLDACKAVNDDVTVSMVDNCSTEVEVAFRNNASVLDADASISVQDVEIPTCEQINMTSASCIPTVEQSSERNMDSGIDGQVAAEDDNGKPRSEDTLVNVAQVAMSDSQPTYTGLHDNPFTVEENTGNQDVVMETGQLDNSAPRDFKVQDFCSAIGENDTDFLNVDDDEADFDEEVDNEVPNTEEPQSVENSGWSTRTRGVARYLRSLFDDESGVRKTTVAMDHLLAGKTRKEASRMFFETLVLKTKDFIHVEQENPFRNINIQPRSKLLKSDF